LVSADQALSVQHVSEQFAPGLRVDAEGIGGREIDLGIKPELVDGLTAVVEDVVVELEAELEAELDTKLQTNFILY
jgi:hypothetical protein